VSKGVWVALAASACASTSAGRSLVVPLGYAPDVPSGQKPPAAAEAVVEALGPDLAEGHLALGPAGDERRFGFRVLCPPHGGGRAYVDVTADGTLEPGAVLNQAPPTPGQRGMACGLELRCPYPAESRDEPYQIWLSVEGSAWPHARVRYAALCHRRGSIRVDGKPVGLVLVDEGSNGRYDDDALALDGVALRPGEERDVSGTRLRLVRVAASGAEVELRVLSGEAVLPPTAAPKPVPARAPPAPRPSTPGGLAVDESAPPLDGLVWVRGTPPSPKSAVLLFFWATWCGPCKRAIPAVLAEASRRGIPVVAVSLDDDVGALDAFLAGWRDPFPERVARAPGGFGGPIARAYAIHGVPTTVVVDPAGRVAHYGVGVRDLAP
jgi:thiol-disulfide isomerase/thioredoxin